MIAVEALAALLLARVHSDRPPDHENEVAAHAGHVSGDGKLKAEWALPSQQNDINRDLATLAIVALVVAVTTAQLTINVMRHQEHSGQSRTALVDWRCAVTRACDVAGREAGP